MVLDPPSSRPPFQDKDKNKESKATISFLIALPSPIRPSDHEEDEEDEVDPWLGVELGLTRVSLLGAAQTDDLGELSTSPIR